MLSPTVIVHQYELHTTTVTKFYLTLVVWKRCLLARVSACGKERRSTFCRCLSILTGWREPSRYSPAYESSFPAHSLAPVLTIKHMQGWYCWLTKLDTNLALNISCVDFCCLYTIDCSIYIHNILWQLVYMLSRWESHGIATEIFVNIVH